MNRLSEPSRTDDLGARIRAIRSEAEHLRSLAGPLGSGSSEPDAQLDLPTGMLPGDFIPGYAFIRELYRGGQGIVYEAMHLVTSRRVAIKLRRATRSGAEIRRFEREAELLTRLRHPNIVAVHDAGIVSDCPYIVMDLVDGRPLDGFVVESKPRLPELLQLIAKVCGAVNAAHLKGVIHRDLKPANIFVDEAGEPRVLDFGLARELGADPSATEYDLTRTGTFIGSLPWASPEQAAGDHAKIDLRTDVYSLGVVLYQLLTGRFPYDVAGPMRDVLNRIVTVEPIRPRAVVQRSDMSGVAVDSRVGSPATAKGAGGYAIDDELETIVIKCLAKDPVRRYQSAGELARDIHNYVAGAPIEAKRDSGWYVLRKALRRHRGAVVIATAFLLLLTGATVVSTVFWQRAERETRDARQQSALADAVNKFMDDMLGAVDPGVAQGRDSALLREILDTAAARIETELADQPEVEAAIRATIGKTYHALGSHDDAERHTKKALDLRLQIFGENHALTLQSMSELSALYHDQPNRRPEAIPLAERALTASRNIFGNEHQETFEAVAALGEALRNAGRAADAEPLLMKALESLRARPNEKDWTRFAAMINLALLYQETGRAAAAEPLLLEAVEGLQRVLGAVHPMTWTATGVLAEHYREAGRIPNAEPLFVEVIEAQQRAFGPEHARVLHWQARLAQLYLDSGRPLEAERTLRHVVSVRRRTLGDNHPTTLMELTFLAIALAAQDHHAEAESLYVTSLAGWRRLRGNQHPDTAQALSNLGRFYSDLKRFDEAEPLLREALIVRRTLSGNDDPDVSAAISDLATLFQEKGDNVAAEPLLREALDIQRRKFPAGDLGLASGLALLGSSLLTQAKYADAEPLLRECLEIRTNAFPEGHPQAWLRFNTMSMLGESLTGQSNYADAEPLLIESYEQMQPPPGPVTGVRKHQALKRIVLLYEAWNKPDQAARWRKIQNTFDINPETPPR